MTVEELINELMASCQSLDDVVVVGDPGIVTLVAGDAGQVWLNSYEPKPTVYACGKALVRDGVAVGMWCNQPRGHEGPC